jgi:hypothetical protein
MQQIPLKKFRDALELYMSLGKEKWLFSSVKVAEMVYAPLRRA